MTTLYVWQLSLLLIMSFQDLKWKKISLFLVIIFLLITLRGLFVYQFPVSYEMVGGVLGILLLLKLGVFISMGKSLIGNGDLLLLFPLLMSLHLDELSGFLIVAGIGGALTVFLLREQAVPFVPALTIAYTLVLLGRLGLF